MKTKPRWYRAEHDSAWSRVKKAFANDWEQTKHDFGSDESRDLDQDVDDTVKQAAGSEDAFENHEQAFRFGFEARSAFGDEHPSWDSEIDERLKNDYGRDYDRDRRYIRHAYEYRYPRP
jgi:hypothetical protein